MGEEKKMKKHCFSAFVLLCVLGITCGQDLYGEKNYPQIVSIEPHSGVMNGGTYVQLKGNYFSSVTHCRFGLTVSPVLREGNHVSNTSVTCVSPAQDPGTYEVQVSDDGGSSWYPLPSVRQDNPTTYTFYEIPKFFGITPDGGPASSHTEVRIGITGWENSRDHEKAQVLFDDKLVNVNNAECQEDICWLVVSSPQICFQPNSGENCERDATIRVSLNGQDFTLDPAKRLVYHYHNEWAYFALLEEDSFTIDN
eukprot:c20735_g5_i1.p1 GENE.c20735_g5_i1~~c20735_g5_i1.p1  ORF type:complete len:253 (-),score=88.46 c20735_g5_i1:22-780(-)